MPFTTDNARLNRQAILHRVYAHFIFNRQPAGRVGRTKCTYHGTNDRGQCVSCAIGILDTQGLLKRESLSSLSLRNLQSDYPELLADVFGVSSLSTSEFTFLNGVQAEHDLAARYAAEMELYGAGFDAHFVEELTHRIDRFAREQSLVSPCSQADLQFTATTRC